MIPHVRLTLFEVVLLAGAALATLAYVVSESTATVTIARWLSLLSWPYSVTPSADGRGGTGLY